MIESTEDAEMTMAGYRHEPGSVRIGVVTTGQTLQPKLERDMTRAGRGGFTTQVVL
jgi:hypothetical protein